MVTIIILLGLSIGTGIVIKDLIKRRYVKKGLRQTGWQPFLGFWISPDRTRTVSVDHRGRIKEEENLGDKI